MRGFGIKSSALLTFVGKPFRMILLKPHTTPKRKSWTRLVAALVLSIGLSWVSSCHLYPQTLENSVGDNYLPDVHMGKILRLVEDAQLAWADSSYVLSNAGVISYSFNKLEMRHEMWFDYKPDYFEIYDGVRRKGTMSAVWSGDLSVPGTELRITMITGFGFNDWNCSGTIKVQNWGEDEMGHTMFGVESDIILLEPAYNFEWTNEYVRVKIRGEKTQTTEDDWWAVGGRSYARNRQGRFYNATIKDSLYFANACKWGILKGRVDIQQIDATQRIFVDYGSATDTACHEFITFTRGGKSQTVSKHLDGLAP
jgi:hypothetical protein